MKNTVILNYKGIKKEYLMPRNYVNGEENGRIKALKHSFAEEEVTREWMIKNYINFPDDFMINELGIHVAVNKGKLSPEMLDKFNADINEISNNINIVAIK